LRPLRNFCVLCVLSPFPYPSPSPISNPMNTIGSFTYERFAPSLPRDKHAHHQVAIAGGGPIGLATALGLAKQGVSSVVIEADNSVCEGSRAICISRRSLQILQRLGVLDAFMAKGLPWTSGRSYYKDQEVLRFSMPHAATDKLPPMINIAQYHIEQFLLDEARKFPDLIDIRWASSVTQLQSRTDGVTLTVTNDLGEYTIDADWLVAADGGQSFIRKSLGLKLEGQAFTGKFVIVDVELHSPFPTERRAWFDCACNPGSTMLMHKQPDNIWRIDYQIPDDADLDAAIQEANVRPVVERHLTAIGEAHLPWKYLWSSAYRAGTMTLDNYVHGRVVFAGNAAHAMPIFGVRGLNSGFEDADNLMWKLAMVVKGQATAQLLETYSTERIAAYHVNATNAGKSTEFMAPGSRGFALMREAALSLAGTQRHIASLLNPRQTSAVAYDAPLTESDGFTDGLQIGQAPVDVPVQWPDGTQGHLLDRIASGFCLLVLGGANSVNLAQLASHAPASSDTPIPNHPLPRLQILHFKGDTQDHTALATTWGWSRAYLLRPDGHIASIHGLSHINRAQKAMKNIVAGETVPC
jgi:3-(3-hydroxy-phenyl)propionate hydroxylase